MDPNPVRAPNFNLEFNQRELAVRRVDLPLYRIMGNRLASSIAFRSHACAALRMAADGAVNCASIQLRPAVHQRQISLMHLATAELFRQSPMRLIVFRHHHQPAGGAVEAMHNSWTQCAADSRQLSKMM